MAYVSYIASPRAPLISGHTAGTRYNMDVRVSRSNSAIEAPKTVTISLSGKTETTLHRVSNISTIALFWNNSENPQMMEFLYSIAGGERFSFDLFGSVLTPDNPEEVIFTGRSLPTKFISAGDDPWRSTQLSVRKA